MSNYYTTDPNTGSKIFVGYSEITPGNHKGMPARTDAYLETDERGHIQASSLGGTNKAENIAPMAKDLNHGAYYQMENGERSVLKDGEVQTEKTAYVSNQPGGRPDAFMVNDTITVNGKSQHVHLSFANMTNAQQEALNNELETTVDIDAPNPGDSGRASMSKEDYAALMEETDADLPNIQDEYDVQAWNETAIEAETMAADTETASCAETAAADTAEAADAAADMGGTDDGGASPDD